MKYIKCHGCNKNCSLLKRWIKRFIETRKEKSEAVKALRELAKVLHD